MNSRYGFGASGMEKRNHNIAGDAISGLQKKTSLKPNNSSNFADFAVNSHKKKKNLVSISGNSVISINSLIGSKSNSTTSSNSDNISNSEPKTTDSEKQAIGNGNDKADSVEESKDSMEDFCKKKRIPITNEVDLKGHTKAVTCISVEPAGNRLVTGSLDYAVQFFDFGGKLCLFITY